MRRWCGASNCYNVGDSHTIDIWLKSTATSPHEIARDLKAIALKRLSITTKAKLAKRIGDNFTVKRMIDAYSSLYHPQMQCFDRNDKLFSLKNTIPHQLNDVVSLRN